MKKTIFILILLLVAFNFVNAQDNYFRQFDGSSQSIYIKDNASNNLDITNNWTIEAWVKVNSYTDGTWSVIMDRRSVFSLYLIDDANADFAVKFVARDGSDNIIASLQSDASSTNLSLNEWFHVAVKYDGTTATLYLNGIGVMDDNADHDFVLTSSTNNLNIGARYWGGYSRYLDGSVDQVHFSNTARYSGNFTPDFYTLPTTDGNSMFLLNLEQDKNDAAGNFSASDILNHGTALYLKKARINPTTTQNIDANVDGDVLSVTEETAPTSREWKYTTTTGGNYQPFSSTETSTTYTPNFSTGGTYYVVCQSNYNGTTITSNEVQINVTGGNSCSISPTDNQYILTGVNGTQLSITETPSAADNREWTYTTTAGGTYQSFSSPETGTTYTPNFNTKGTYYVVCKSNFGGTIITSNEVQINVDTDNSNYYLAFDGDDSFYVKDDNQDYINISDNYTIETWVKVDNYTAGTYPVIMDREKCFSLYVQGDGAGSDDFSIAFARRDASDNITASLSSANNPNVTFNFGEWYHIAVTYNGTEAKMFINGTEVTSNSTDDYTLRAATTDYINVGCRHRSGYERYLSGSLENIQISKVAKYTNSFTPDFYTQQTADDNSIVCLNLENNGESNLFDFAGNFDNISLRNSPNDAEWKNKAENSISPTDVQTINVDEDGNVLTVSENGLATSRLWKYTTTSGFGYTSFNPSETSTTYTPTFSSSGIYYVVCQTNFNGTITTSNEVQINVQDTYSNTITPTDNQYILTGVNGTRLTVTESTTADSREWKYSTTSGGTYVSFSPAQTETTYTPNFSTKGTYYVVCQSNFGGTIVTSNEIQVNVDTNNSDYYLAFDGDDSFYIKDDNQDYINISDNYTIETWVKVDNYTAGTYPVIMDREKCFSIYVQSDGTGSDDFSIAFARRDASDNITASLSSANNPNVTFNFGEWYHIAVTYNGTEAKMFINGTEVTSNSTDDYTLRAATTDYINVGCRHRSGYERYLSGSLENIQISKVAKYTNNFTPDFYTQQTADDNSIVCLNLENNGETNLFDFAGNFNNISLRNSPNDAEWKNKAENSISPTDVQTINVDEDGNVLTVSENGLATSRLWKYTTTSGSGYVSFNPSETGTTYTPTFSSSGIYYVVCQTNFNGTITTSNEVQINVQDTYSNTITPNDNQYLFTGNNGDELTVTETYAADSRVWKYSTTPGGTYTATTYTSTTFTPNFATKGNYYVVCVSEYNGATYTSTEVQINVEADNSDYYLAFDGDDSFFINDNTNNDLDASDNYTYEAWVKVNSYNENDWSVIMDRRTVFSLYLVNDNNDDFAVAFATRDGSGNILSSLSSANTSSNLEFGKWFHVAVTRDGTNARLFLDGELIETSDDANFILTSSTNAVNVGARYWGGYQRYLNGAVENINISDVATYTTTFTVPDFYAQQTADDNSIVCLNLENNEGTDLFDFAGNFDNISLRNSPNNAEWKYKFENSITPTYTQTVLQDEDGDMLTVTENGLETSREWKYTTTSGSGYVSFNPSETGTTYTPTFSTTGTYFVVCQTTYSNTVATSNEVEINVITTHTNTISPTDNQYVFEGTNGTHLDVTETPTADSREWKYATTSGGTYQSFSSHETSTTYTPNFDTKGTYYVVCESTYSSTTTTSNEVKINVDTDNSDYYLAFDGDDSFFINDNTNNDLDVSDNYTFEAWVKVDSYNDNDWSVIMDRKTVFSLYLVNDDNDDFAVAFATRDGSGNILSSLSSANTASNLEFGKWFHVAVTRDGTNARLFIDGELIQTSNDANFILTSSTNAVNVGARYWGGYQRYLSGAVENINISDVATYTETFTVPDFYTQQTADNNSIVCLNLENYALTDLFDFSGNFSNIGLRTNDNEAEWKNKAESFVSPIDEQNINIDEDGNMLTVTENGISTGNEWKFSTTQGSGYTAFATPEIAKNYTPNFSTAGTYYVVCQSIFNGITYTSNEVVINVTETVTPTITTETITGSPFVVTNTTGVNVDVPYTITGSFDDGNVFTAYLSDETGSFATETAIGTINLATNGTISAEIPAGTASGTAYRIRVKSDNPVVIGADNGVDLEIQLTTSIADVDNSIITIYPNPVSNILNFEIDNFENTEIQIFDNLGRLVFNEKLSTNSIDISSLQSGSYTIRIKNNNKTIFSHFIKF